MKTIILYLGFFIVCLTASTVLAQTTAFNYQGKLTDNETPQLIYQMEFKLFASVGAKTRSARP